MQEHKNGCKHAVLRAMRMACGLVPVTTNAAGVHEVINEKQCGYVVAPGSAGQTFAPVSRLIDNPNLRYRMRLLGHHAAPHFSWSEPTSRLLNVYPKCESKGRIGSGTDSTLTKSVAHELNVANPDHAAARVKRSPCSETLRLSWAVVTRNRTESLARALRSLARQDPQPHEVWVSDDSSSTLARRLNCQLVRQFGFKYCRGPNRGLYSNRNHVALRCVGTHIRTMDDDHELPRGHMDACIAAIHKDPRAIWSIGEVHVEESGRLSPLHLPGQLTEKGVAELPDPLDGGWPVSDGAAIYPRVVFDEGHRYLEEFPFGAAYLEFGSYLKQLGFNLRVLQDTHVVHHLNEVGRSYSDPAIDLGSRIMAVLCHVLLHRPSPARLMRGLLKCIQYGVSAGGRVDILSLAIQGFATRFRDTRRVRSCRGRGGASSGFKDLPLRHLVP